MLELSFTAVDVAYTRFAISPLWEAVAGARLIKQPHPVYGPWLDEVRPRLHGIRWELLDALIPPRGLPAFLAPPPAVAVPDLDLELATLRATPPETLATDLAWLPPSAATALLGEDPDRGLALLADQIAAFWETAVAPYWPKIRALLEGDLLYRARQLADGGAHRLLNTLDPTVEWSEDTLRVQHRYCTALRALRGRGLLLVPSAFTWPNVWSITTAPWQPTLRYGTRGIATLWERRSASVPQALAAALGRTRALLLTELATPASTTDLSARLGLTKGGVSQHLTVLRDAGFVSAHRTGRFVLYARTGIGEALCRQQ
ncbi:winged helix-turn-helix transcriptional regulator [Nonomuraea sp. FMUSA5-5]|uniref:Winged helix-turn-helix transcriptional regulator n=1 Tax=Nonomuraea composti TaxID=2720023 RepID=A0ABX1BMG0_9ACTN|nr:winged helix-turn-helix transcriptional regulator [Nonomuraea sp. FMUSA5-5]